MTTDIDQLTRVLSLVGTPNQTLLDKINSPEVSIKRQAAISVKNVYDVHKRLFLTMKIFSFIIKGKMNFRK